MRFVNGRRSVMLRRNFLKTLSALALAPKLPLPIPATHIIAPIFSLERIPLPIVHSDFRPEMEAYHKSLQGYLTVSGISHDNKRKSRFRTKRLGL